jgi:hypothetical protein
MINIKEVLFSSLKEATEIIAIVFILMVLIEIIVLKYKPLLLRLAETNSIFAYIISSIFGIIPNCSATFAMDSLYMSGYLSFGGLIAVMISTVDDVGLLVFSKTIENQIPIQMMLIYFSSLLIFGIIGGKAADILAKKFKWKFSVKCDIVKHEHVEFRFLHFFKEHIIEHIFKKHIWKIFLWMFITLFIIDMFPDIFSRESLLSEHKLYLIFIAALVGIIPSPAPNFFILNMFALNPGTMFSVFLTNSIVQDGHGLLPILGYSYKDAIKVKMFKLVYALITGLTLYSLGF